ncbi:enterotoxin A family protein [Proteus myxofaciens]|uniref:Pertussis toxin subunit 1 n=1 Tax=Proteus myxofaciens ATCC 19692 TaxID=1354337 RepID=A0A198FD74_9GAMM|nr:enterotoxin A family protein [Proteus myxofaciens]OAT22822.1 hypothetical protein M983_2871 [Proteus myxofaciens ATCC 19692]
MIRALIVVFLLLQIPFSWAINPTSVVYRADSRTLSDIHEAGGMWPLREGAPDNDLTHHFEGESIDGMCSNFVSTSQSLRAVVEHAISLSRPNEFEPYDPEFVTYIYVIRPDLNFYDVEGSLTHARNSTNDANMRNLINRLLSNYSGMEELVARDGFSQNRILSYARLDADMLQRYGTSGNSALFTESFWASRWVNNPTYDYHYDQDISSSSPYQQVGMPEGAVLEVSNGTQPSVRLGETCLGVSPNFNHKSKQKLKDVCSKNEHFNVIKKTLN